MDTVKKTLKSRTVWVIILAFLTNGVQALTNVVSPEAMILLNSALSALAIYFKMVPSQDYSSGDKLEEI